MSMETIGFARWAALILVSHAFVQAVTFLVIFGTNAAEMLNESVEYPSTGAFVLDPLTLYPFLAPFSYYVTFAAALAYVCRYGRARRLAVLGMSIVFSATTLTASFFASFYSLFFLVVGAWVVDSWMERFGAAVHLVAEYVGSFLSFFLGFGGGGAMFGVGLALGLAVMRLWPVTRGSLLVNASGCAIGALLLFSSGWLLQLPWSGGDRDPAGLLPWAWLPIAVIAAIPHVYLTWRALRRGLPVVAPTAG